MESLGKKLNVVLSSDLETSCPQFVQLLQKLSQHLNANGRTKESEDQFEQQKDRTEAARRKYLSVAVRLAMLKELIQSHELKSCKTSALKHEAVLLHRLKENLISAEVECMLDLGDIKGEAVTTLGLDKEDIKNNSSNGTTVDKASFGQKLLPMVEDVMFSKCLSLLCLLEPDTDPHQSRSILHPSIQRLSDKVADLVTSQQMYCQDLAESRDEWRQSFQQQVLVLQQIADNMEILVKSYFSGSFAGHSSDMVKCLSVEIDSLLAKVRTMILEVDTNLYTRDSVLALKKVRNRIQSQINQTETEIVSTKTKLEQYQKCGPELSNIVVSYSKINKEIEMKKWALAELQRQ